jgi:hypothetical protein
MSNDIPDISFRKFLIPNDIHIYISISPRGRGGSPETAKGSPLGIRSLSPSAAVQERTDLEESV